MNKAYISIAILFLFTSFYLASSQDPAVVGILPTQVNKPDNYKIKLILNNYGDETVSVPGLVPIGFEWSVFDGNNLSFDYDHHVTYHEAIEFKSNGTTEVTIGEHFLDTGKTYTILARLEFEDNSNKGNDWFVQYVNGKPTDAGVYIIDSPSPASSNPGGEPIYVTVKNYGFNKIDNMYIRWLNQDASQSALFSPADTFRHDTVAKFGYWSYNYFRFDTPINPGEIRQIKVSDNCSHLSDVLLCANYHPNGIPDNQADDTCRAYFGPVNNGKMELLGKYSVGNDSNIVSQFETPIDVINHLKKSGFSGEDVYGVSGATFYIRPGKYPGSWDFDGMFNNQDSKNTLSFTSFDRDLKNYFIYADKDYGIRIKDMKYLSVAGMNFYCDTAKNAVVLNNVKFIELVRNNFFANNQSLTGEEYAAILNTGRVDSTNILNCNILNGSYGVLYKGNKDKTFDFISISHCYFMRQSNAAISLEYCNSPLLTHNMIPDNRIEVLNCPAPAILKNNLKINDNIDFKGKAYPDGGPYSAIGLFNCEGIGSIINNYICTNVGNFDGMHIIACINDKGNEYNNNTIINKCNISSDNIAVRIEGSKNIQFNKTSLRSKSADSDKPALFVDANSSSIKFTRSLFANTNGGLALDFKNKSSLEIDVRNNYYSTGSFANISGKFISEQSGWESEYSFSVRPEFDDPQLSDDCTLIPGNTDIKNGAYHEISVVNAPNGTNPAHQSVDNSSNTFLEWESDEEYEFWIQMSESPEFPPVRKPGDISLSQYNIVIEKWGVSGNSVQVSNLENKKYYWRVRVWDSLNISDWSDVYEFSVNDPTDIPELTVRPKGIINLIPHPAGLNSYLSLNLDKSYSAIEISLFSNNGEIINSAVINNSGGSNIQVPLKNILPINSPSGTYHVTIRCGNSLYRGSFVYLKD